MCLFQHKHDFSWVQVALKSPKQSGTKPGISYFQFYDEGSQSAHLPGSDIAKKGLRAMLKNMPKKKGSGLQESDIYLT